MLILSRKEEEGILLSDNIKIKILSIDKGSVKIGIDAPNDVSILREELKIAVTKENKDASQKIDDSLLSEFIGKFS